MNTTFNFLQLATSATSHQQKKARSRAATVLREAASSSRNEDLALLATSVELDAFTKVKKAIDDMIATLKTQQADEVKKNDWCKSSIQDSDMTTMKTQDRMGDLQAKVAALQEKIKALEQGIVDAKNSISETEVNLQRASEDRKAENLEFQTTVS